MLAWALDQFYRVIDDIRTPAAAAMLRDDVQITVRSRRHGLRSADATR